MRSAPRCRSIQARGAAAGRVYAAYGVVYVSVALVWLRVVDGVPLTLRDLVGSVVVLAGMGVLMGGGQQG